MRIALLTISIAIMFSCKGKDKKVQENQTESKNIIANTLEKKDSNIIITEVTDKTILDSVKDNNDASKLDEIVKNKPELTSKKTETILKKEETKAITKVSELKNTTAEVKTESEKKLISNSKKGEEIPKTLINTNKETPKTEISKIEKTIVKETPKTNVASSHKKWGDLLKKHVDNKGNVNYKGFKNDEADLQSYLDFLAKNKPSQSKSKNERLAYYINLYNAATVKLILENFPVKSIKDIKSPWDKKWVKIGNETVSLGYIEHKILRKMNEPRIHFAINCASYSCPQLFNTLFTASNMNQKLEEATKIFINDTSRNKFEDKISLSRIFKWYKKDFTDNGTLLEYIAKYTNKKIDTDSKIEYLTYDWSLNEKK